MVVTDSEETPEAEDRVGNPAAFFIDHDALDRPDLLAVGAKTGVPSTLSLPIRLPVSLASVAMWHLQVCDGHEIEKTDGSEDCSGPRGDAIAPHRNPKNRFASGAHRVITPTLVREDEIATFGYPRERSF